MLNSHKERVATVLDTDVERASELFYVRGKESREFIHLTGHHWLMAVSRAVDICAHDWACLPPEQSFLQREVQVFTVEAFCT